MSESDPDKTPILYQDGLHDDTEAIQALLDGKPARYPDGRLVRQPRPTETPADVDK